MFLFTYFQNFLASLCSAYFSFQIIVIWTISANLFTVPIYLLYPVTFLQVSTKMIQAVLKKQIEIM